jgi:hypothetical protein
MMTKRKRIEVLSPIKERQVKISRALALAPLLFAAAALYHAPAQAGECLLPNSGPPIISVNPKPFTEPPPATCRVGGLPAVGGDLPGYTQVAATTRPIVASSVTVGTLYDRVYCIGTGGVCSSTMHIIATRVHMSNTVNFPARNTHCPMWSGTTNECFEINNFFRNIIGGVGNSPNTWVSYWMGTGSASGTNPDTNGLSLKYLEYTGKTYKGINQVTPPGTDPPDRDNSKVMFWADTNIFDPDGEGNSEWSPWLFARQDCAFGGATPHFNEPLFAIKYWQGGEEGQIQKNIQAQAYACKTS